MNVPLTASTDGGVYKQLNTSRLTVGAMVNPSCVYHQWLSHIRDSSKFFQRCEVQCLIPDKLLSLMQPFPAPRSVIILDNARIHRNRELQELCTAAGVRVEYLPPYTPDFNPIEKSFAGLKAWKQENRDLVAAFGADFAGFLFMRWRLVRICSCVVCLALGMMNHVTTR